MQVHVVDSSFGLVKVRFVAIFLNNHSLLINHSGRRQGQGQDQDQGQGQGQDHEKVRQRSALLQLQMVLALTLTLVLVLTLALAPSRMINKKGMITSIKKSGIVRNMIYDISLLMH